MARETEEAREATEEEKREQKWHAHLMKVRTGQAKEAADELDAMAKVLAILHPLPEDSRKRALRWAADRLDNFTPPIASFNGYSDEPPF